MEAQPQNRTQDRASAAGVPGPAADDGDLRSLGDLLPPGGAIDQSDILSLFPPEQQALLEEKRDLLSALAYFIGKDFDIPVELNRPGAGWHWDFGVNKIRIDPVDLLTKPLDYLRAVICHEGGHRRITRAGFVPAEVWNQPGFSFMINANEDPRNDSFIAEAYPRYREQIIFTYNLLKDAQARISERSEKDLGYKPRFIQAGFAYLDAWFAEFCGGEASCPKDLPDDVREVVEKTLPAASESWRYYPTKAEADSSEARIEAYARIFYRINLERVWPEFKKLVEKDLEDQRVSEMLRRLGGGKREGGSGAGNGSSASSPTREEITKALEEAAREGRISISSGPGGGGGEAVPLSSLSAEARERIRRAIDELPPEERARLEKEARDALRSLERAVNENLEAKLSPRGDRSGSGSGQPGEPDLSDILGDIFDGTFDPSGSPVSSGKPVSERKPKPEETKDHEAYRRNRTAVAGHIERFAGRARAIFKERRKHEEEAKRRTGLGIDIRKRISEIGKGVPAPASRAWEQRTAPREKDFAIALLVDLSGSMSGNKIEKALRGAIVMSEPLHRLNVSNGVFGFNTKLYTYKDFKEELSPAVRAKMGHMLHEVGSKHSFGTDDGWALSQVSEWLEREKAAHKFIVVLTDGQSTPTGPHAAKEYVLSNVLDRIRKSTDQRIVAFGLGPNTGFVDTAYPNGQGDIPEDQLADKLADLLEDIIENYNRFKR